MTPAARLQMTIEILAAMGNTAQPADRFLRDWFRTRRFAGSKDRAAIGERVFAIARHRASLAWRMQEDSPRALVLASLLREGAGGESMAELFGGQGYGPAKLSDGERARIENGPKGQPPLCVQCDVQPFLEPELLRAFDGDVVAEMESLNARAPVDLRVNTLKATREEVLAALEHEGYDARPAPYAPDGIRIAPEQASAKLGRSPLFESGAFEFQDEAAQIAAILCGAKPGDRVLDLAAGAGGKSLALAAAMRNEGTLLACDVRDAALAELRSRAGRAGVDIIRTKNITRESPDGAYDIVLLDAPCSGSGTWRRQPELKWRLTPARLEELKALQDRLLDRAAECVRPGGHLVCATCSILPRENEDRIAAFLLRRTDFASEPVEAAWNSSDLPEPPPGVGRFFHATPLRTGTDGFFVARMKRRR